MEEGKDGYVTRKALPREVLVPALLACAAGFAGFVYSLLPPEAGLLLAGGGLLVICGYDFWANGAINRLNYFRTAAKYLGLLLLSGALVLIAWYALGRAARLDIGAGHLLAGLAAAAAGALAYHYGSRYHQNLAAVELGLKLGFRPADSGFFSADGFYDAKGELNGLQVLFNLDTVGYRRRKYGPVEYDHTLEVLCRCGAAPGLKFHARPRGAGFPLRRPLAALWAARLAGLPAPEGWDRAFDYRCSDPQAAARALEAAAASAAALSSFSGLREMRLDEGALRLTVFSHSVNGPYWDEGGLRRLLDAATRLAAAF